ncbi:hypothetical protein N431DRAFT_544205 [Stipitochalara longipes BDJ]|nr:hypothetical protein N431DRAFT_544205 [Stipitochalara longipes BDJ]
MDSTNTPRQTGTEGERLQPYAPYGKACINCARSKTRCAVAPVGGKCERCHRLNKDCYPAPSVRKKRVSKKPVSSTALKTAALEEKLDGLVQMLQRSQPALPEIHGSQDPIQSQRFSSGVHALASGVVGGSCSNQFNGTVQVDAGYGDFISGESSSSMRLESLEKLAQQNGQTALSKSGQLPHQGGIDCSTTYVGPLTPAASICGRSAGRDKLNIPKMTRPASDAQIEEYLKTYRTSMVAYFPIVCLSQDTTVEEMRSKRPFLLLVICAICSKNLERQAELVLEVKKILANEMVVEGTRNLDLFLGILVFAGWCHLYICNKPIISTVIHLAISLASDLGLTKPLSTDCGSVMLNYSAQGCPKPITGTVSTRTMEERRAVIGLYLVSSVCANYFQRIELMRWSRYLDECLRLLEVQKEYPTDELLVSLARIQLICNKGATSTINDLFGDAEMKMPADFYAKSLKSQLDELERSISPELKFNVTIQLHILNAILTIHERSLTCTPKSNSSDSSDKLQCTEYLWTCFIAVKSWFNTFFSLEAFPLSCYTHISMLPLTQMAHCLVALFRLSTFESPGVPWDRQRVRQEMDFGDIVQLIVDRFDKIPQASGIEVSPGRVEVTEDGQKSEQSWFYEMRRILVVRPLWEAKVAAMTGVIAERTGGLGPQNNSAVNECGGLGMQQMDNMDFGGMNVDMLDDNWIRDMLGGGYDFGF